MTTWPHSIWVQPWFICSKLDGSLTGQTTSVYCVCSFFCQCVSSSSSLSSPSSPSSPLSHSPHFKSLHFLCQELLSVINIVVSTTRCHCGVVMAAVVIFIFCLCICIGDRVRTAHRAGSVHVNVRTCVEKRFIQFQNISLLLW